MKKVLSLSKDKIKVLLLEGGHPRAVNFFADSQYVNVERLPTALSKTDLEAKIKDVHVVGIRSRTRLTAEVLENAPKLMAIGCFCIGTNQVDLTAASLQGIPVFNAPHSNTRSVAELVIGHTIMLMRGIFPKSMAAHEGTWFKSALRSHEVRGKTMGIVGYGHIGTQVSILAEALGMRVLYHDILSKLPLGNAKPVKNLEDLLKKSDVVTLHVPEDPGTLNLMDRTRLEKMKKGAYLINASRGKVVDIEALGELLEANHLYGAAVDVFPVEPKSNEDAFHSRLIGLENVILTPHIGGSTIEAQENIAFEVVQKLVSFSDTGATEGTVNFPPVNLPPNQGSHRILHIHRNIPGILRQINMTLADQNINVLGQFLATNEHIGYVVLDVAKDISRRLLSSIKDIDGTIRTRVLY